MKFFDSVAMRRPKKNKFNLSHEKKLSCQMATLVPIMVQEVLPGDKFKVNTEIMMRLAPMIAPVMHRMNVYTHYFFVPNRIVWNEWEDFITGGKDGTAAPIVPHIKTGLVPAGQFAPKGLCDYMGLPVTAATAASEDINVLAFRAYQEIYNEYYRDQNLSDPVPFTKGSGEMSAEYTHLFTLRKRAWEKDYFTSALPWTQRGPEVGLPIDVAYKSTSEVKNASGVSQVGNLQSLAGITHADTTPVRIENIESLSEVTINDLRKSVRLQEWLEKNARGGARYIEQLMSHFGKAPRDARLQRPEYLTGSVQPIVISEVLNTAGGTGVDVELDPVGEMAGHGISVGANNGFTREFEEHGHVIGIMSVLPRTAYQQGIPKMYSRKDKLEYAWPEFAQLGEQPILNREIYFDGLGSESAYQSTFGYTPRYSEYKYGTSTVHGDFKTTQDFWHLGRKFTGIPPLNENFVMAKPEDTKRIFAVTDTTTDDLYVQIIHNVSALRPLPYYGTPTL